MQIITAEVKHSVIGVMSLAQKVTQLLEEVLTKTTEMKVIVHDVYQVEDLRARLTNLKKDKAEDQQQLLVQDKAENQQQLVVEDKAEDQKQDKPKDKPRPSTRASEAA